MNRSIFFSWSILSFVFLIPLSQYLGIRTLVAACLISLFIDASKQSISRLLSNSWDIGIYLLVLILGLLYSENLTAGWKVLETNFSMLAIAIIFCKVDPQDIRFHRRLYYSFSLGLFLACIICLINALYVYIRLDKSASDSFFFYNLTNIISFQPTYFAYYLIFAVTYGLYLIHYQKEEENVYLKFTGILFLFLVLLLTGGQTAFISMLLVLAFFVLKFLVEEKSKMKIYKLSFIVFMVLCMFFVTMVTQADRTTLLSDSWDRMALWESAIDAIPNPLLGVGTGDYKAVLNNYYVGHGMDKFASESYNSHNQFIQLLFSNGVLGVLALIIMISRPLYIASKNDSILVILCIFPFLIYGITEVFLGRYQGVVFFAFLHQFFTIQLKSKSINI